MYFLENDSLSGYLVLLAHFLSLSLSHSGPAVSLHSFHICFASYWEYIW